MGKDLWKEGVCEILVMLFMIDGAIETMEYMWVGIWCMLDWIMSQDYRNAFLRHELLN